MSRTTPIAAAVGAVVLALLAGALLGRGDAPEPVATKVVRSGPASVVVPRAQRVGVSLAPLGRAPRGARETRIGGYRAWTHSNVTVLPTTAGALTVTCAGCVSAVESVSVRGGAILEPTPELALALRLPEVEKTLDRARVIARKGLRAAKTPKDQAGWARRLADAHRDAAAALKPVAAGSALVDRLDEARQAYAALGPAATSGSARRFDAARERIGSADTNLARAIGDVAPVTAQPPEAARPNDASHDPSLPLLAVVVAAFGALGAGLALSRSGPRPERRPATPAKAAALTCVATPPPPRSPIFGPLPARPPAPAPARMPMAVAAVPAPAPAAPDLAPVWRGQVATPAPATPSPARARRAGAAGHSPAAPMRTKPAAAPPRRAVAPAPNATWTCELTWSAGLRSATFCAKATGPGQRARLVGSSPKLSWPPLMPAAPEPDLIAAARALARALMHAGWTPTSRGSAWYAQRFAWTHDDAPPQLGAVQR